MTSVLATPGPPTITQTLVPFETFSTPFARMLMAPSLEAPPKFSDFMLPESVVTLTYFAPLTTASVVDPGTPLGVQFAAVDQDPLVFRVDVPAQAEPVAIRSIGRKRMNCFIYEIKLSFGISQGLVAFGSIIP